jgi:hypothetical protein
MGDALLRLFIQRSPITFDRLSPSRRLTVVARITSMNQLEKFRALPGMDKFKHLRQLQGYSALSTEGIEYIERVFASEPARAVGQTSLLSVSGSYASAKFPHLTDYESAGCEKPYVLLAILNDEIVDILAQPAALRIVTHDKRGRRKPRKYVADYIEFGKNCFSIVEAKEQWEMEDLARKTSDWQKDNAGNWRFLPGIAIAERYGMGFRVFCPDKFTKVYLSNLQIVARLPGSDLLRDRAPLIAKIRRVLADRPRTILELCRSFNEVTGALIYQAIAKGKLFGLLDHQHLDNGRSSI